MYLPVDFTPGKTYCTPDTAPLTLRNIICRYQVPGNTSVLSRDLATISCLALYLTLRPDNAIDNMAQNGSTVTVEVCLRSKCSCTINPFEKLKSCFT